MDKIRSFEEYRRLYQESVENPDLFWDKIADSFLWKQKWHTTLEYSFSVPEIAWFQGSKLNITDNCLDRHLKDRGDKIALLWEPNNPEEQSVKLTYQALYNETCKFANVLKQNNVKKGERVIIYMPMVPELMICVLACARIGAVHSVVFGGFSATALADRIKDCSAKIIVTADGAYRGAKQIPIKAIVDDAVKDIAIDTILVATRTNQAITMRAGRDKWIKDELNTVSTVCPSEEMDAQDPLFILYTSGSTGKPKGILHACGGYMVYAAYSFKNVFQYEENDIHWCTADIGWITGHSYITYGPLLNGATTLMFEGVPTYPDAGRFWQIIDKYSISQFYTAPTAIRALIALGDEHVKPYSLDSLKVIGTVGEPINEEAWKWYHTNVGKEKCPVVDTWWQTETGGIMISGLGNISPMKPTYAGYPLPGIQPFLVDRQGNEINQPDQEGYLAIKFPWPSILKTIYGDHKRCKDVYFGSGKFYLTGDSAKIDENGMYRIIGRIDDVINVSGHRLGTAEIENAINKNAAISESAVIAINHAIKGQAVFAYVVCKESEWALSEQQIIAEVTATVENEIGKLAKPECILIVDDLPKTRSGKIMRRILSKIAQGNHANLGDISTLLNPDVVKKIIDKYDDNIQQA